MVFSIKKLLSQTVTIIKKITIIKKTVFLVLDLNFIFKKCVKKNQVTLYRPCSKNYVKSE